MGELGGGGHSRPSIVVDTLVISTLQVSCNRVRPGTLVEVLLRWLMNDSSESEQQVGD